MEKPWRYFQALAGEPVHFLGIKAKSFLPLISKAMGQEREMSDLNISDVVPNLGVKLQHSTVLNTNNFALIWILVTFKGKHQHSESVLWCWATESWRRTTFIAAKRLKWEKAARWEFLVKLFFFFLHWSLTKALLGTHWVL